MAGTHGFRPQLIQRVLAALRRVLLRRAAARRPEIYQVAALPVRVSRSGRLEVLLISTRGPSGKLIIPRGWPMKGKADFQAAACEAEEEAGVLGPVSLHPIGTYKYRHERKAGGKPIRVDVYRLDVMRCVPGFKERGQRRLTWVGPVRAAELVGDPGLAVIIRDLVRHEPYPG